MRVKNKTASFIKVTAWKRLDLHWYGLTSFWYIQRIRGKSFLEKKYRSGTCLFSNIFRNSITKNLKFPNLILTDTYLNFKTRHKFINKFFNSWLIILLFEVVTPAFKLSSGQCTAKIISFTNHSFTKNRHFAPL